MFVSSRSSIVWPVALVLLFGGSAVGLVGCDGGGASSDPPSPPSSVEALSRDGAVELRWERSSAASGYNVYRATNSPVSVETTPVNGEALIERDSFRNESVTNGTRYYYRVTAVGEGGESDPSSEVSARPFPTPPDRP